jgi:microcystin-dependent protein
VSNLNFTYDGSHFDTGDPRDGTMVWQNFVDIKTLLESTKLDGNNLQNLTVATAHIVDGAVTRVKMEAAERTPVGAIFDFIGTVIPTGYLLLDGSTVSRATYAALYTVIGDAYGAGDGTSTFQLPDFRGRVAVGKGTHVDVDTLGDSDGVALASRRPKHSHTVDSHAHAGVDHLHGVSIGATFTGATAAGNTNPGTTGGNSSSTGGSTYSNLAHSHSIPAVGVTVSGTVAGSTGAADRALTSGPATPGTDAQGPSYLVVNKIIKF